MAPGRWRPGGASVTQSVNGDPTFFVSPTNQIDTTVRGTIRVAPGSGDDDFIGFVLGFTGPASTGNDMNFVLFDWKQGTQTFSGATAQEGLSVSRVNGTITDYTPGFWGHTDSAQFDVLGTDFGVGKGWVEGVTYNFTILYQTGRIKIDIAGGTFGAGSTVFDINGSFPDGRFGFYNYSQSHVTYAGLTEESTPPPPPPPGGAPVPGSLALLGLGLVGLTWRQQRRR